MKSRMKGAPFLFSGLLLLAAIPRSAPACGNWYSDTYLTEGREASVLEIPNADFTAELGRLLGHAPNWSGRPSGWKKTIECDVSELKAALADSGTSNPLVSQFGAMRRAMKTATDGTEDEVSFYSRLKQKRRGRFDLAPYEPLLQRLPAEFALYARGAAAYRGDDFTTAERHWRGLLALPPGERRRRSTWAAFMIGKAYLYTDPPRAIPWFERTRALARESYADSLGLAAMSLGWQAWAERKGGNLPAALRHYYEMGRAGTQRQYEFTSLQFVCAEIFKLPKIDPTLITDPTARKILTAWAISRRQGDERQRWLGIVKHSGVKVEPVEADNLAWGAYRAGQIDEARQWLALAVEHTPIGQWVQSKLLLRDGRVSEALALLKTLAGRFPPNEEWAGGGETYAVPRSRINGERGTLLLGREDYVAALDAFARSGYWEDTAYIAERVLTLKELSAYLRRHKDDAGLKENRTEGCWWGGVQTNWDGLNYLLARRLARAHLWRQARPHYPPPFLPLFDDYVGSLRAGLDQQWPRRERAESLFKAAWLARYRGMALLGAENEPDWITFQGDFTREPGVIANRKKSQARARASKAEKTTLARALSASQDEIDRVDWHDIRPEMRFHYRYGASELAWECAQLLPDNDPLLAAALYWGGNWHRSRDVKFADRFYQELVRRCPKLPAGKEADKIRWFPHAPPPTPQVAFKGPKL